MELAALGGSGWAVGSAGVVGRAGDKALRCCGFEHTAPKRVPDGVRSRNDSQPRAQSSQTLDKTAMDQKDEKENERGSRLRIGEIYETRGRYVRLKKKDNASVREWESSSGRK